MDLRARLGSFFVWMLAATAIVLARWRIDVYASEAEQATESAAFSAMEAAVHDAASSLAGTLDARAAVAREMAAVVQADAALHGDALAARVHDVLGEHARGEGPEVGAYLVPEDGVGFAERFPAGPGGARVVVDDRERYRAPTSDAWFLALTNGEGGLTFPGAHGEAWVAQYAVPIYQPAPGAGEKAAGIVFVRYSWADVERLATAVPLGKTGYAFVVTASGEVVGHPRVSRTAAGTTLESIASRAGDGGLAEVGRRAHRGETGSLDREDPATHRLERLQFAPVGSTGWSVVAVASHREAVHLGADHWRAKIVVALLGYLAVYTLLAGALTLLDPGLHAVAWAHALGWSGMMLLWIATFWGVARAQAEEPEVKVQIADTAGLDRYLAHKEADIFGEGGGDLVRIPTGLYIASLSFPSANDARVTGIVWQRFLDSDRAGATPGVIFPEAVESQVDPLYERPILADGARVGTLHGWSFRLTVREKFDFRRYPFDTKDVWLRMWARDFDSNVVLVPDLDAYPEIAPDRLPGLDTGFILAGWEPLRTYFQYREGTYSTNFGNRDYVGATDFPELSFTLDVQRDFLNTFISDLVPLAVVTFLLFGVIRTISPDPARYDRSGFSFTNVLAACSGLVFVVLLGHIQLRSALAGQQITYLEWYYFIIYVSLILVCLDAWLVISESPPRLIAWSDNLLCRLLFFPWITTSVCIATAFYFVPSDPPVPQGVADVATAN